MLRIVCLASIALLACFSHASMGQEYSPKFPTPIKPAPERPNPIAHILVDVTQTMQVRKLLQEDEMLKAYNLGVRVEKRVAILWGPVPSPEVARRAEQRIRRMIEIAKVRNETVVMVDEPQRSPDFGNPRAETPGIPMKGLPKDRASTDRPASLSSVPTGVAPSATLTGIEASDAGTRLPPTIPAISVPVR
ncbi:MAG: BON domain-containing protein [Gemmataceae bacterium]